ncbi:hypothetical protein H4CHR_02956 [Variovorax sp. PBS-H4]|uniref:hypothetical protein n=1 Tax=Variovorax sp. PBS-H4 TaxID=434008 RepID=UPI00131666B6|nr:hypothetical protein [Variovorax sp. PBS-H4]VTU32165.1 hypothetical protein H4CHR_02956 [Variovorax sp. PBS-H4]
MSTLHTKGPWTVINNLLVVAQIPCEGGETLAVVATGSTSSGGWRYACSPASLENAANLALMAAAPELSAALSALLDRYVALANSGDAGNWDPETEGAVKDARAALAKTQPET